MPQDREEEYLRPGQFRPPRAYEGPRYQKPPEDPKKKKGALLGGLAGAVAGFLIGGPGGAVTGYGIGSGAGSYLD